MTCQLLRTVDSLSFPDKKVVFESRKSILRSRIPYVGEKKEEEDGQIIGWTLERKIEHETLNDNGYNEKTLEVSVNWCHHGETEAPVSMSLPLNDEDDEQGLSCYLWPSAIAGSILFTSPLYRSFLQNKNVLELGSGLGVGGMVAAAAGKVQKCVLTDRDEYTVSRLRDIVRQNKKGGIPTIWEECDLSASILDWRDFVGSKGEDASYHYDVILGTDLAYYHHLIRPLMDVSKCHLKKAKKSNYDSTEEGGVLCIVGQANRESQWDLYENIQNGSYNQITDEHEGPWDGDSCLLLYDLGIGRWEQTNKQIDDDDEQEAPSSLEWDAKKMEEIVPIATLLHSMDGKAHNSLIGSYDKIATKDDEKHQMISF